MMLPYETIGKAAVAILAVVALFGLLACIVFSALYFWIWFWTKIVRWGWKGYDPFDGPKPPRWRRKVSIIAHGLREFKKPSEIREVKRAALDGEKINE